MFCRTHARTCMSHTHFYLPLQSAVYSEHCLNTSSCRIASLHRLLVLSCHVHQGLCRLDTTVQCGGGILHSLLAKPCYAAMTETGPDDVLGSGGCVVETLLCCIVA